MAGNNFQDNDFGIQDNFVATDDDFFSDASFGGSTVAAPEEVKEIKEETPSASPEELITSDDDFFDPTPEESSEQENSEDEVEEDDSTPYEGIYKDVESLGLFTPLPEGQEEPDTSTAEGLAQRFKMEFANQANNFLWNNILAHHGDEGKEAFKAIFIDGVKPNEYFSTYNNIVSVAELEVDNEDHQETIIRNYYLSKNKNQEFISKKIQKLKDLGEMEDTATEFKEELIEMESEKLEIMRQQAEAAKQNAEAYKQHYNQEVNTILSQKLKEKEFDSIPVTQKVAQETAEFLLQERYQLSDGSKLSEFDKYILDLRRPENYATKVKLALLIQQMQKDPTFTSIQKKGISKEVQKSDLFANSQRTNKGKKNPLKTSSNFLD